MSQFFSPAPAPDPLYNACRDHGTKQEVRERIEELWKRYEPYCPDAHFLVDAQSHFVARTWELYVACALLEAGFELERPAGMGPDIATSANGNRLWVEAVAPDSGAGADAVPGRDGRGSKRGNIWQGHPPNEASLILRCTGGLSGKLAKLADYRNSGIVSAGDACVIALTLGGVEDSDISSPDLPIIIKAVFGVGEFYRTVPIDGGESEQGFFQRPTITKKSGADVGAQLFCEEASRGVAGVLFTDIGIWNAPEKLGRDLVFVHNPMAGVRLPVGVFAFAEEYYVGEGGRLSTKKRAKG